MHPVLTRVVERGSTVRKTRPEGRPRRAGRRFGLRAGIVAAAAAVALVTTATPALAHNEVSQYRPPLGAAARTVIAGTIDYNLNQLGLGCPANHRAVFSPTWRISNVTTSSIYIDYLKITFRPYRNARLTHATLVDGNTTTRWRGNWAETSVSAAITRTFYFRRTVSWGSARQINVTQWFGFNSDSAAICSSDKSVVFKLVRP